MVFFLVPEAAFSFYFLTLVREQDNGGRKPRKILQDAAGDMDLVKVVDWVVHNRLESVQQNNDPTGNAKLRKACFPFSLLGVYTRA